MKLIFVFLLYFKPRNAFIKLEDMQIEESDTWSVDIGMVVPIQLYAKIDTISFTL